MDKTHIFEHYSSIIDSLIDSSSWFKTFFQCPWSLTEGIVGKDDYSIPYSLSIRTGCTRVCIIDENEDYVIKFDIDEDCEGSACERECEIYASAREVALDQYLCEASYIGTYTYTYNFYEYEDIEAEMDWYDYEPDIFDDDLSKCEEKLGGLHSITVSFPLYAYRRVEQGYCSLNSDDYVDDARSIRSPLASRNVAVAASFIAEYGMDEYKRFSEFAEDHRINDLHLMNVGGIAGRLILMDYAGYHDGYSSFSERT